MKRSNISALVAGALAGLAASRTYKNNRKVRLFSPAKHVVMLGAVWRTLGGLEIDRNVRKSAARHTD